MTMGRQLDSYVVVSDKGISRHHAAIVDTEAGHCIRDLSSMNGTFVNDERIDKNDHLLKDSDTIRLGAGKVSYVYHSPTAETVHLTLEPTEEASGAPTQATDRIEPPSPPADAVASDEPGLPSGDEIYEGTVRLNVKADADVRLLVAFVQRLGDHPDCRLLKLLGDAKGGVEAWLGLRQPVSLSEWLGAIDGVVHVSATRGRDLSPESSDRPLTVLLKAEDLASAGEWLPCGNCEELLERGTTVCPRCDEAQTSPTESKT